MGRRRTRNHHLPPHMHIKAGHYYYVTTHQGRRCWTPLGDDYARALLRWRSLEGLSEDCASIPQMLDNALSVTVDEVRPSTLREYRRAAMHLKPAFEGFMFEDLKPKHVGQYLDKRTSKTAANREVAFLSAAWNRARKKGWTDLPNPCEGIKRNKEIPRKRTAHDSEIRALFYNPEGMRRESVIAYALEFSLRTGLRRGDVLNFTLSQIETDGLRVKPRKTADSTGAELFIVFDSELRALVERARRLRRRVGSIYLFANRKGQPYTENGFQSVLKRYVAACGVKGLTFHDMRRTAINFKRDAEGIEAAQRIAAHSSVTTTERYLTNVGAVRVTPVSLKL